MLNQDINNKIDSLILSHPKLDWLKSIDNSEGFDFLGLDSLDVMELTFECEKAFDISIDDKDIVRCQTIGELKELCCSLASEGKK